MTATTELPPSKVAALPRYDRMQRALHWIMAVLILTALGIGLYCSFLTPGTPVRRFLLDIHKSLGMTALVLLALRIAYALIVGVPAYSRPLGRLVHRAAQAGHLALYAVMLFMPLTGYMFSAAGGYSLPWFGLLQWPRLLPDDKQLAHFGQFLHGWGALALYGVLALHIGAVIWHQFVLRDEVLQRMLPPAR